MTKRFIVRVVLLIVVLTVNLYSQYPTFNDSLIFKKWGVFNTPYCVQYLGDENNDGYDDIMLGTLIPAGGLNWSRNAKIEVFHGGSRIDTIPYLSFNCYNGYTPDGPVFGSCDINGDGYRDIVYLKDTTRPLRLSVLFGGPTMDTIPDMTIPLPDSLFSSAMILNKDGNKIDFDGDGIEELAIWLWIGNQFGPNKGKIYDCYIYKTGTKYTGNFIKMNSSTKNPVWLNLNFPNITDLDGDGCSDFLSEASVFDSTYTVQNTYHILYYGDAELKFTRRFMDNRGFFAPADILPDMNNDGKGEICNYDWYGAGGAWVNYYLENGSYPPDTLPTRNGAYFYYMSEAGYKRGIGDINGDGYNDLIVTGGNPARANVAQIFLGGRTKYQQSVDMYDNVGVKMCSRVGDLNGDGCEDILIGQYNNEINSNQVNAGFVKIYAGKRVAMSNIEDTRIEEKQVELTCYPNPTTGEIKVVYSLPQNVNNAFLSVYDMLGKEIKRVELLPSPGRKEASINLKEENISSGVYIANIRYHEKGELKNKAIKIQYVK